MKPQLVARASLTAPGLYEWLEVNGTRPGTSKRGDANTLAAIAGDAPLAILLHGEDVASDYVTIPARNYSEVRAVAPYAIEDNLIADVEALEIVTRATDMANRYAVAWASRAGLQAMAADLVAAGVRLTGAWPDYQMLALPPDDRSWTALVEVERVSVRTGAYTGFSVDTHMLAEILCACSPQTRPSRIEFVNASAHPFDLPQVEGVNCLLIETTEPALAILTEGYREDLASSMLSRSRGEAQSTKYKKLSYAALALVLITAIAHTATLSLQVHDVERKVRAVKAEQEALFRATFPEIKRLVNVEVQARQALADLQQGAVPNESFLRLLHAIGSSRVSPMDFLSLNYANDSVQLTLATPTVGAIESFSAALVANHVSAQILSADTQNSRVTSRVRVSSAAP